MTSVKNESGQPPISTSSPYEVKLTRKEKLMNYLRIGTMLFFEIFLPLILYYVLKQFISEIHALLISGIPPLIIVIYGIIAKRRIDTLGAIVIISFIVSAVATTLKNNPRIYLLRESTVTGSIGLTFLLTLIPIKYGSFQMRPLTYYFAKDMQTGGSFGSSKRNNTGLTEEDVTERWEIYWKNYAVFRRGFYVSTIFWGIGLLVEVPARTIIALKVQPFDKAVLWTNIVTYSWLTILFTTNHIYSIWFRKKFAKEISGNIYTAANKTSV
ncbi:hypothetical protein RclHR1_09680002 [Rhizophagus clarus]|uniref:Uncharacterized protein n=1 Tax=Rhizophagus clarus TaxID=94130 RepID=A0A2Z6SJ05_9GLOM|nr:hypothetical protein RclHR1_09680002 [Rhizophagus clarus]GES79737.1 hypothetical protein GLOIN_2v1496390 [Rhizophagus clarus]